MATELPKNKGKQKKSVLWEKWSAEPSRWSDAGNLPYQKTMARILRNAESDFSRPVMRNSHGPWSCG